MADDMVAILTGELVSHGATGFRVVQGGKHKKLYWTHDGREMWHLIAGSPSDVTYRTLALNDVRRAIGVNQGAGPGERRVKGVPKRRTSEVTAPPEVITVSPDPMTPLLAIKQEMEKDMEQQLAEAAPVHKIRKETKGPAVMPMPTARERQWLEEMLIRGEKERHIVLKRRVTPGLATAMLELNLSNRLFTENQVVLHEGRLRRGDFVLTHQGIAFSKTRTLNDGQHRLMAIARSGINGDLQITFGAEREEFRLIDMGRQRRAKDIIGILVKDSPDKRASLARMVLLGEMKSNNIDPELVAEKALSMQEEDATEIALLLSYSMRKVCGATPISSAYYWIATRSPSAMRVNEFFDGMPSGEGLAGVKLKLREWLRDRNKARVKAAGSETVWRTAGIILAWNAWVRGSTGVVLDWKRGAELPEPR